METICAAVFNLPMNDTATLRLAPSCAIHSRKAEIVISLPMMTTAIQPIGCGGYGKNGRTQKILLYRRQQRRRRIKNGNKQRYQQNAQPGEKNRQIERHINVASVVFVLSRRAKATRHDQVLLTLVSRLRWQVKTPATALGKNKGRARDTDNNGLCSRSVTPWMAFYLPARSV